MSSLDAAALVSTSLLLLSTAISCTTRRWNGRSASTKTLSEDCTAWLIRPETCVIIDFTQSVCNFREQEVFYVTANTGVIYNFETREQRFLQGHVCYSGNESVCKFVTR